MKKSNFRRGSAQQALRYGASALALGAAAIGLAPTLAFAQAAAPGQEAQATAADDSVTEVVVTGVRQALKSAQQIKRDADTVVDSITASDIGAFPDKSVAEALQRVAGITVNRFAATSDTAHFSAEPSGVIVRGLPQVRSEFNGRDSFTANSSRGLGWGDISPELMAGVDAYKNQTAELIEGGIAGTINLRTRTPFDSKGRLFALSVDATYGDLADRVTPSVSGIWSDRWDTKIGEFGLMANYAYSRVITNSEGIQYGRTAIFDEGIYAGKGLKYIPSSVAYRDNTYDRTRNGAAFAAQWQDNDHKFLATLQYNRSKYKNVWREYVATASPFSLFSLPTKFHVQPGDTRIPQPAPGTPDFTFDDQGNFQTGVMTSDIGWWGANDAESAQVAHNSSGQQMVNACYGWNGCTPARRGGDFSTDTRYNTGTNVTEDLGFNLKWNPTDQWRFNFDVQRVEATVDNYDIGVGQQSFANIGLDASGKHPKLTLLPGTNINLSPGGLLNPNAYRYNYVQDHVEKSEGEEFAVRADAQYLFDSDWLESIKVGVRFADRDQTVRWGSYNWANIANTWSNNAAWYNLDSYAPATVGATTFTGYQRGLTDTRRFSNNFYGGGLLSPQEFVFFNMDVLKDPVAMQKALGSASTGVGDWNGICSGKGRRSAEVNCFLPSEILDVSEESKAAYAMLKFGGGEAMLFGHTYSGNIGVRYVETTIESTGATAYPQPFNASQLVCVTKTPEAGQPPPPVPKSLGCYLSAAEIAFNTGATTSSTISTKHENWLPSFNFKFDINDKWLLRFAASRSMSRPDMGNLKNYRSIGVSLPDENNASDPRWVKDANNTIVGVAPIYTASSQNPRLKPITADQYDLSLEHYFADVGSLSVAVFYKQFHDYIQFGTVDETFTSNGVTRTVQVNQPFNGEGAKIQGLEVAYQRYFDFLPAPFDGLGVQANYTYVKNKGIVNSNVTPTSGDGGGGTSGGGVQAISDSIKVNALEGLSEHAYNVVLMYEKGPWAGRIAYNWRSKYLVTAVDCCVAFPVWQDNAGFLDASIRYKVNDNTEISLQGSNLLASETVLRQQVTDYDKGGKLTPNGWFKNDRRIQMGVRLKY
jgi:iron complex outermembrane receptor protein